jgi:N-acetylmuramoyl-L-alanine amidase
MAWPERLRIRSPILSSERIVSARDDRSPVGRFLAMDERRSVKRRMLREAVRENVDVIAGRYRFRKRSKASRLQAVARFFFFVSLPLALAFSSYLIASATGDWLEQRQRTASNITREPPGSPGGGSSGRDNADVGRERSTLMLSGDQVAALEVAPRIDTAAFPLEVRRIIVDPGHGGENEGTASEGGLVEKDLALDIARRLRDLLVDEAYDVELTREKDAFVSLEDRARIANARRGDVFISIHLNWLETRDVRGVETYFLGPTNDPYLTRLAADENRHSGYSLADFRAMLDRVYADVRQAESERFAFSVQQSLYNALRKVNPRLQDRGVKKAPFIVLVGTEMPAILAEVSCLSNKRETRLLKTPEYRQYIARALFAGVDAYAREMSGIDSRGS